MTGHNDGSQTEVRSPLGVAADAVRHTADDIAATERNAEGLILDAMAMLGKGIRLLDGDGTHDDPVTRHLAPAHLWHGDATRRTERASLLRSLACVLEANAPPHTADLAECVPAAWAKRIVRDCAEDVLRGRMNLAEAASGMSRRDFDRTCKGAAPRTDPGVLRNLGGMAAAVADATKKRNNG